MVYGPFGVVVLEVVIVRVEVPDPVTEAGLKVAVAPVGKFGLTSVTAPAKPSSAETVTV